MIHSIADLRTATAAAIKEKEAKELIRREEDARVAAVKEQALNEKYQVQAQLIIGEALLIAKKNADIGLSTADIYEIPRSEIDFPDRYDNFAVQSLVGNWQNRDMATHEYVLKEGCRVTYNYLVKEGFKVKVSRRHYQYDSGVVYMMSIGW